MRRVTRRQLLRASLGGVAGMIAASLARAGIDPAIALGEYSTFFPFVTKGYQPPTPTSTPTATPTATATPGPTSNNRVVHVHAPTATNWGFDTTWYGSYVSQAVVNSMVEQGLMQLTGMASVSSAWNAILPSYQAGEKIAIKVNFNNSSCSDSDNEIDALIEPVNALIRSLVNAGIAESDIWVYDASRPMPARFYTPRLYKQARYIAASCADATPTFSHVDPSLRVLMSNGVSGDRWLADLLFQARYLINMPILKGHGIAPVTLGFKNHFGSIDRIIISTTDDLHPLINASDPKYRSSYSPFVDIFSNSNIAGKTVLTIGDGLFGASGAKNVPPRWRTWSNGAPNSLFFSRDPVAIDSVMCAFVTAEFPWLSTGAYDYLVLAAARGLGTFEQGDPWGSGYRQIDYLRVDV